MVTTNIAPDMKNQTKLHEQSFSLLDVFICKKLYKEIQLKRPVVHLQPNKQNKRNSQYGIFLYLCLAAYFIGKIFLPLVTTCQHRQGYFFL